MIIARHNGAELTSGLSESMNLSRHALRLSLRTSTWVGVLTTFVVVNVATQWPAWRATPIFAFGNLLASLSMLAVALMLWTLPNMKRLGVGCMGGALCWSFQGLVVWNDSILPVIGIFTNASFYGVAGIGLVLTPDRIELKRTDHLLLAGFCIFEVLIGLVMLVSLPEWNGYPSKVWWPTVYASQWAFQLVKGAFNVLAATLAIGFCLVNARHIKVMKPIDRVVAVPVIIGFCFTGIVAGFTTSFEMFPQPKEDVFFFLQSLAILSISLGFAVSWIRRIIRRAFLTEQLSRHLSKRLLTGDVVRDEFRRLLGDDTIEIYYWSEEKKQYVDTTGANVEPRLIESFGFIAHLTGVDSTPIAVVTSAETILDHTAMLESLLAASSIAIENIQLQANIKSQLQQVRASRARIVSATLEERRRIERDLHDGVQQRLLAIQAKIGVTRRACAPEVSDSLKELSDELGEALGSLRNLARGIHPPELSQFGLRGALEVVAERLPIDVRLKICNTRFPTAIESTIYFVVCEALTNVVKHSEATISEVSVAFDGDRLFVLIEDDGNGQAKWTTGGGLEGLHDRLKSIGGDMELATNSHGGTTLSSTIPDVNHQAV